MRKVKLLLADLHVESFTVQSDSLGIGTVRALEAETVHTGCYTHCPGGDCEPVESVLQTHCDVQCPSWDGSCGTTIEA